MLSRMERRSSCFSNSCGTIEEPSASIIGLEEELQHNISQSQCTNDSLTEPGHYNGKFESILNNNSEMYRNPPMPYYYKSSMYNTETGYLGSSDRRVSMTDNCSINNCNDSGYFSYEFGHQGASFPSLQHPNHHPIHNSYALQKAAEDDGSHDDSLVQFDDLVVTDLEPVSSSISSQLPECLQDMSSKSIENEFSQKFKCFGGKHSDMSQVNHALDNVDEMGSNMSGQSTPPDYNTTFPNFEYSNMHNSKAMVIEFIFFIYHFIIY
jgi:hypothetical protein